MPQVIPGLPYYAWKRELYGLPPIGKWIDISTAPPSVIYGA